MKRCLILVLLLACNIALKAQTGNPDKETLLDFYQNQRYTEAAKYLEAVYGRSSTDPKVLSQIAYANLMAGQLPEAERNYLALLQLQPSSIPVLFNLASVNLRRGNDEKAKGYYMEILKTDSSNFKVYKQLASLYPGDTNPEKIKFLEKANKLNPAEADVAYDLATAYNTLKQDKQAYQVLDPALKADTANFILLKVKLPVCVALLKLNEAGIIGNKLMAEGDSTSFVVTTMGKLSVLTKSYQKAIYYFKLLENWDQENETSLYYTALCYRALKNYQEAAAYTLKTIEFSTSPNMSSYYTLLGTVYEEKLQYKLAISAYKKGIEYTSKGGIYYNMALLEDLKLKEPAKALTHYRLYLKSKPDPEKNKDAILYVKDRIAQLSK